MTTMLSQKQSRKRSLTGGTASSNRIEIPAPTPIPDASADDIVFTSPVASLNETAAPDAAPATPGMIEQLVARKIEIAAWTVIVAIPIVLTALVFMAILPVAAFFGGWVGTLLAGKTVVHALRSQAMVAIRHRVVLRVVTLAALALLLVTTAGVAWMWVVTGAILALAADAMLGAAGEVEIEGRTYRIS